MRACRAIVAFCAAVLVGIAPAQSTPDEPTKTVHISGRLVFPNGSPASFHLRMDRVDPDGFKDVGTAIAGRDGRFTFTAAPGMKYRISLAAGGMKTPPKRVETFSGKDIDVGDMVFEYCSAVSISSPKPPATTGLIGDLKPEQILIEPQPSGNSYKPFVDLFDPDLPRSTFKPDNTVELPPCWSGPSLDRRWEWESFPMVSFDRYLTIESFVGGKVKNIRVVHYNPRLTPSQIREEVRKVWLGSFWFAASSIMWQEGNLWNVQAVVEFEDGRRTSIMTDGGHVALQDREGKIWYIRLWPAVQ